MSGKKKIDYQNIKVVEFPMTTPNELNPFVWHDEEARISELKKIIQDVCFKNAA
jgi:hypothetical protein